MDFFILHWLVLLFLDLLTPNTVYAGDTYVYLLSFPATPAAVINSLLTRNQHSSISHDSKRETAAVCRMPQAAGCKQGSLFQKCKLLSWGTSHVHTLHHPLGRKQFRKELGVCITQRNSISVNLMALNHITKKRLHLNWWDIWLTSQAKTQKGWSSSIYEAKEKELPNWSM